jgi:hypothetical protein
MARPKVARRVSGNHRFRFRATGIVVVGLDGLLGVDLATKAEIAEQPFFKKFAPSGSRNSGSYLRPARIRLRIRQVLSDLSRPFAARVPTLSRLPAVPYRFAITKC